MMNGCRERLPSVGQLKSLIGGQIPCGVDQFTPMRRFTLLTKERKSAEFIVKNEMKLRREIPGGGRHNEGDVTGVTRIKAKVDA